MNNNTVPEYFWDDRLRIFLDITFQIDLVCIFGS